mgnify:CR=1 FL=1|jgi:hypothetical protein
MKNSWGIVGKKMTERFCKKCNKMCHCTQAGSENECTNCDCNGREEDSTYEGGGVIIDDTGECESCQ